MATYHGSPAHAYCHTDLSVENKEHKRTYMKLIANNELGSRCLKGQWEAKCNRQRGGIHGNPRSGNHPRSGH